MAEELAGMIVVVRPERVAEALALARTLAVPQPTTRPADGLVQIVFPPLTDEQSFTVMRSGLVHMSAKIGIIEG